MPSRVARQRAFAQRHSTIQPFWGVVEDISLLSAALLTLGINPSSLDEELEAYGEPVPVDELPDDFLPRIEVLRSAIRAGSLKPTAKAKDKFGRLDETKTRIKTGDFVIWCNDKGIPHNIPTQQATKPNAIPISGQVAANVMLPQAVAPASPSPSQSPYDPLPLNGIAAMIPRVSDAEENRKVWRGLAKNARKNGLDIARVGTGSGTRQSTFDPSLVGDWLVNHQEGKFDRARVDRILLSNLPPRSAHLKDLLAP